MHFLGEISVSRFILLEITENASVDVFKISKLCILVNRRRCQSRKYALGDSAIITWQYNLEEIFLKLFRFCFRSPRKV